MIEKLKEILNRMEHSRLAPLVQFVKFGLVGVSNTAISYAVEMLCYYVLFVNAPWPERTRILVVTALAFLAGTANSYFWNNRYVFSDGRKKTAGEHAAAFLKMAACYALTGLVMAPALKVWLRGLGVAYWLASLSTLIITIPLNFLLNKLWAFRSRKKPGN